MRVDLETTVEIPEDVVFRTLEGEAIILDVEGGRYYGLDEVGTRMWTAVTELGSVGRALDALEGEYEVERARLRRDLEELVATLIENRLLRVGGSHRPSGEGVG